MKDLPAFFVVLNEDVLKQREVFKLVEENLYYGGEGRYGEDHPPQGPKKVGIVVYVIAQAATLEVRVYQVKQTHD